MKRICNTIAMLSFSLCLNAQLLLPPGGGKTIESNPNSAPLDGGLSILIGIFTIYGIRKGIKRMNKVKRYKRILRSKDKG